MSRIYSGVGSRKTTHRIALMLYRLGFCFALKGLKVRTGGAPGSDDSFEKGVRHAHGLLKLNDSETPPLENFLSVFLPWPGFNYRNMSDPAITASIHPEAFRIAGQHHIAWHDLPEDSPVRPLMARNCHQVLGENLSDPVSFVFCYTEDGVTLGASTTNKTGGTGQAIRVASSKGVPVYNIGNQKDFKAAQTFIDQVFHQYGLKFACDLYAYTEQAFRDYMPFTQRVDEDLVDAALNGQVDAIIQECNCFNAMVTGLSRRISQEFPEAREADLKTLKGDKKKLGTFSFAKAHRNGRDILVINAYTQFKYGNRDELYCDYDKVRKVCRNIRKAFPKTTFGVPRIGAGSANGSWLTLSDILANELRKDKCILFDKPRELDPSPQLEPEQGMLDI